LTAQGLPPEKLRRVHLALLPSEPARAKPLALEMLTTSSEEFLVLRELLFPFHESLSASLWKEATTSPELGRRFRAACALALFAPKDERWKAIANPVAESLVQENPLYVGEWKNALRQFEMRSSSRYSRSAATRVGTKRKS
jgi:hypothetical protein